MMNAQLNTLTQQFASTNLQVSVVNKVLKTISGLKSRKFTHVIISGRK